MDKDQLIQKLEYMLSLPGENEVVEFKSARNSFDFHKLGKYFSALSNEANLKGNSEAWLIFGVDNTRKIVGSDYHFNDRPALDKLKGDIANKTTNRITFIEIYELLQKGGRVVMFHIPAALQGLPIAWEGHYYGRDGEELSPLNLEEIERIRRQIVRTDWSAGICKGATLGDLDSQAIALAREKYKVKNPRLTDEVDSWDDLSFLNKAGITINNRITRSAIILLGKAESEHLIAPGQARITWILKDKDNVEKDYEHFSCPFILAVDQVYTKIRNLKYRYIVSSTLFPDEVDQYDPFSIREALNNCIAHQDYTLGGRINVIESENDQLSFTNSGDFLPGSIENVIGNNDSPGYYRNSFLTNAMVKLNMIDTVGIGIKKMFRLQRDRFFPLPDYDLSNNTVKAVFVGKIVDMDYAKILSRNPDLSLEEIVMLDKVQKRKELNTNEIARLKSKGFIEGRKPNFHISSGIADTTDQKAEYIKNRGFKDQHYKNLILRFIEKYGSATKDDIDDLLMDILPAILNVGQKENKIRNLVYAMSKKDASIENKGTVRKPKWVLRS